MTGVIIRPRREQDLPALAEVLADQQALTGYPVRWPLPFPVEQFLVRSTEERSWVAELDGRVVGHASACRPDGELRDLFVAAVGTEEIAELAVLFVATDATGIGIGGRLIDTVVGWIRAAGRLPVLDVVPTHERALEIYRRRGWQVVGETRPDWLPDLPLVLMALDGKQAAGPG
jgi:GNAT superfamily N-acetyltransferase